MNSNKQKIFLHTCCAPCGAFVFDCLKKDYEITCYFYNPNIWPKKEYIKRRNESKKYYKKNNIFFIKENYNPKDWEKEIKGLEKEPEGGKRCEKCFQLRLVKTAEFAKKNNFNLFATTLSISPHKNSKIINEIGKKIANEIGIDFLEADWKKNDGYKKSCEISRNERFYRQNYCGCKYSLKKF